MFLALWSRSRLKKKQEPEPLGKKIRSRSRLKKKSGAGAAKKFAGSPALPTSNSIVHCLYLPAIILYIVCTYQQLYCTLSVPTSNYIVVHCLYLPAIILLYIVRTYQQLYCTLGQYLPAFVLYIVFTYQQGWGAGAGCFWLLGAGAA